MLDGRTILVVEDEYYIADDLATALRTAGVDVLGPAESLPAAIRMIERGPLPDAAVLDVNLRGVDAYPLIDTLLDASVPVLLLTGYDPAAISERYASLPRLEKPADFSRIKDRLVQMLAPPKENEPSA